MKEPREEILVDSDYSIDDLNIMIRNLEKRVRKLENVQRPEMYQEISNTLHDPLTAPKTRSQIRSMLESESRKKAAS